MKTFKVSYDFWEMTVEIDDANETLEKIREQVLFRGNGNRMIAEQGGDVIRAYLRLLAQEVIVESMQWNLTGIISEWANREGWYPLDGSHGVRLVRVDMWDFDRDEFDIHVTSEGEKP